MKKMNGTEMERDGTQTGSMTDRVHDGDKDQTRITVTETKTLTGNMKKNLQSV